MSRLWKFVLLAACVACARCTSPEAGRTRGGGLGADVNNRPATVKMHEGSDQYWKTPERIGETGLSLDEATHAKKVSRQ